MEFHQLIGLICLVIAGIIFISLCTTFKSVWIKPKAILEKHFEKIDKCNSKVAPQLSYHKETKYNNCWKKIWEK